MLMAAGFLIGFFIVQWMYRVEGKDETHLNSGLVHLLLGAVIGARLGHVLFYEPGYYFANPWLIPAVWKGGLASHGGAIGIFIALWIYTRKHPDQPLMWVLDRVTVPTALAGALIRLGNVFNAEILGRPTDVPWGFIFTRVDNIARHPVQLYEAAAYLVTFGIMLALYLRWKEHTPRGLLAGTFFVLVFGARLVLEFFKERQETYVLPLPLNAGQLLSVPFIIVGAMMIVWAMRRDSRLETQDSRR